MTTNIADPQPRRADADPIEAAIDTLDDEHIGQTLAEILTTLQEDPDTGDPALVKLSLRGFSVRITQREDWKSCRHRLRRMLRQHDPADLPSGDRRSFYVADLVALVQDPDGNELYIAAEASYTADERDTRRAIRNAQLINGFTGMTAVPVIASLGNDQAVQQLVDDGAIRWFQFQPRDLQPQ